MASRILKLHCSGNSAGKGDAECCGKSAVKTGFSIVLILGCRFSRGEVPMAQIPVSVSIRLHIINEQQAAACCSFHLLSGCLGYGRSPMQLQPFAPFALSAA